MQKFATGGRPVNTNFYNTSINVVTETKNSCTKPI